MKHIKTYEKIVPTYKIGDYILYNENCYLKNIINSYKCYALIDGVSSRNDHMYIIYFYDLDIEKYRILDSNYLMGEKILRKLTKEEIDEFKLIGNMNKYNI